MDASYFYLDQPTRGESLATWVELVLLTVSDADFRLVGVEAVGGVVTLIGKVKTESERKQAAAVVRKLSGVHEVNNQLEVEARPADWALPRPYRT